MSAESQNAQIIALNTASVKLAATNDYSYEPGMASSEHAGHIAAVRPKLIYSNNAVRTLGGLLMDALQQHIAPLRFMFRVYTHGDIFLMLRALFQPDGLQTSVRLGLQTNSLGRKSLHPYQDEYVLDALRHYVDRSGASVDLAHACQYSHHLHGLFVGRGMVPFDIRSDGRTVTVAYAWEFEDAQYEVHLVSRLEY
jgi:hypothetical protein